MLNLSIPFSFLLSYQRSYFSTNTGSSRFVRKENTSDFKKVKTNKFFKKSNFKPKRFANKSSRLSFRQLLKKFVLKRRQRKFAWNKNKRPYWRQKFFLKKLRYSNFLLPLASHIRGATPGEIHVEDINERHLWTYNVKYRRARFTFRNKIYMRKTILRRYGFKNKYQLKKYQLRVYRMRRPLDSGFSALEGRLGHIAVRLGWFRSISMASRVIKLGGLSLNGGIFRNPNVLVQRGDVLLVRKRSFVRSVTRVKKVYKFRKRYPFKQKYFFTLDKDLYLKATLNSIYKNRFLRINKFRLTKLKLAKKSKYKKIFKFRRKCSRVLKKRIKLYKFFLLVLYLYSTPIKFLSLSISYTSKFFFICSFVIIFFLHYCALSQFYFYCFNSQLYCGTKQGFLSDFLLFSFSIPYSTEVLNCYNIFPTVLIFFYSFTSIEEFMFVYCLLCGLTFFSIYYNLYFFYYIFFDFVVNKVDLLTTGTNTLFASIILNVCTHSDDYFGKTGKVSLFFVSSAYYFYSLKARHYVLHKKRHKHYRLRIHKKTAILKKPKKIKIKKKSFYLRRPNYRRFRRFNNKRFGRKFVPWRTVKVAMRYLGLRNKLIHPLPLSVFFKSIFALYSVFRLRKIFFSKLNRLSNLCFSFLTKKHRNLKKLLLFSVLKMFLIRKSLIRSQKKHVRLSNKQFEFSRRKAGFVLSTNFRLFSFAWLKSANVLQLNRKIFDVFSNQKLY